MGKTLTRQVETRLNKILVWLLYNMIMYYILIHILDFVTTPDHNQWHNHTISNTNKLLDKIQETKFHIYMTQIFYVVQKANIVSIDVIILLLQLAINNTTI